MKPARLVAAAALALGLLVGPAGLRAQLPATLRGRVVDAGTGEPIAGAVVRVEGARQASAISDPDGRWRVEGLEPGSYRVAAERLGYAGRALEVRTGAGGEELRLALTPAALPLDALVVTASRRLQRLADAPVSTELITRREIEVARVSDLSALLVERLGIQLEGGHPGGEGVMLQGMGSERVLVLMDGEPVVGRLGGTIDVSRIPASMVERVEVVKGPQSSLYGSDAMGGVINIITRAPGAERWRGGVELTAGTQERMDGSVTLGGALGGVRLLGDLGRRSTALAPGQTGTEGALAERWDGLLKLGWAPAPALSVEASAVLLDERQRWRTGQLFHFADNRQTNLRLGASWESGAQRIAPSFYLGEFRHLPRTATGPTPLDGTGKEELQRLLEAELLYGLRLGAHALDLGVEARREEIASERVVGGERAVRTVEPFAQATWAIGAWQLVPGARLTWSEQWGTHLTPRLAALYRPLPSLALRGSLGRGYRAPAFKELAMEFLNVGPGYAYTVRGNPDLRPESSTNLSLGAEWSKGRYYLRGQGFYNRFDDFIETAIVGDSAGLEVYSYGNIADGFTRGLEVEGGLTRGGARLEAGYAYLQAEDARTGEPLLGRPAHSARLSVEHPLPLGIHAGLSGTYTGEAAMQRTDTATLWREGFLRFDLRFARDLPGGLELSLGARNLLDAQPGLWPGYAGRHLYLGIGWHAAGSPVRTSRPDSTRHP